MAGHGQEGRHSPRAHIPSRRTFPAPGPVPLNRVHSLLLCPQEVLFLEPTYFGLQVFSIAGLQLLFFLCLNGSPSLLCCQPTTRRPGGSCPHEPGRLLMTCGSDGLAAACRIPASDAMARGGWGPGRLGKRPPLHVWRKEFPRRGDKTWDPVTGVSGQRQEPGVTLQAAHGDRPLLEGTGQAHKAQSPHGAVEGAGQAHMSQSLWNCGGHGAGTRG